MCATIEGYWAHKLAQQYAEQKQAPDRWIVTLENDVGRYVVCGLAVSSNGVALEAFRQYSIKQALIFFLDDPRVFGRRDHLKIQCEKRVRDGSYGGQWIPNGEGVQGKPYID